MRTYDSVHTTGRLMSVYGSALFVHVVFAIMLVSSGVYTHLAMTLAPHARSVDGMRSHVTWLHTFVKTTLPLAAVVLATGVYLAFAAGWWGAGWPVVSLALFALGGAAATVLVDPRVARLRAALEQTPDGLVTPELRGMLVDPILRLAGAVLVGADLTIVLLMTNKPGWTGSVIAALAGVTAGAVAGVAANRISAGHAATPTPTPPPRTQ